MTFQTTMITPAEILEKAARLFYKLASDTLAGTDIFPVIIPANKKLDGSNFSDWKKSLEPLYQHSKAVKPKSYTIHWTEKTVNGIKQQIPKKIYFETLDDYLGFTKKEKDFSNIYEAKQIIAGAFPALTNWAISNPALLLKYTGQWPDIIKVLHYFVHHPPPHPYYIRELPIAVHSKFIETNTGILKPLLDTLLPDNARDATANDFTSRYYLKKPAVLTQIRILDDALKPMLGYDECSLTIEDAAFLKWVPQKVFIIENQACYLSFPKVANAVAIWGEGFKSRLSRHIPWLHQTQLYCWFDLDASGFEMLNMIRSHYPEAKSFLMNQETLDTFSGFIVTHFHYSKYKQLQLLDKEEKVLYQQLIQNHQRLEQERISQVYVMENL